MGSCPDTDIDPIHSPFEVFEGIISHYALHIFLTWMQA